MTQTKRLAVWEERDYPTVYANMMGIGMTPFDINLILGEVTKSDDTTLTGTPKVKVLMTPEQAQNLIKLLGIAVTAYEKANGAIRTAGAIDTVDFKEMFDANLAAVRAINEG